MESFIPFAVIALIFIFVGLPLLALALDAGPGGALKILLALVCIGVAYCLIEFLAVQIPDAVKQWIVFAWLCMYLVPVGRGTVAAITRYASRNGAQAADPSGRPVALRTLIFLFGTALLYYLAVLLSGIIPGPIKQWIGLSWSILFMGVLIWFVVASIKKSKPIDVDTGHLGRPLFTARNVEGHYPKRPSKLAFLARLAFSMFVYLFITILVCLFCLALMDAGLMNK